MADGGESAASAALSGIGVATNIRGEYYFTQIFIRYQ